MPASSSAWQPLTFGGVAAFAGSSLGRLIRVQLIVAVAVAASMLWFLVSAWFPELEMAIHQLPERGMIRSGRVEWAGPSPTRLVEGTFLSITVDVEGGSDSGTAADVQILLGRDRVRVSSLVGRFAAGYPQGWIVSLNRTEAQAWWGAWQQALLVGAGVATLAGSFASWFVTATLYSIPMWLIAFYGDRRTGLGGCWRMAGAAVLPGALVMCGAILLYSFHRLNLIGLVFAWLLHILVGWLYAAVAPLRLPRRKNGTVGGGNPFQPPEGQPSARRSQDNPFSAG